MELLSTWLVPHSTPNGLSSFDTIGLHFPKFDLDLVSSPRTSQPSQFSNSMRSPFTDVASTQSSELAQPSYFSNPALMDDNNLPSLNVDTNSLPTPTRGRRWRREPSPSPPLSPASSIPHQRPRNHTYASHFLSTLTIAPSPWPALLVCINEFSINQKFWLSMKLFLQCLIIENKASKCRRGLNSGRVKD